MAVRPGSWRRASGNTFTLVTGLPGSDTPLLMRMLAAAGLPSLNADRRTPLPANTHHGVLEWEAIQGIDRNPAHLERAGRHAINLPCSLISQLPWHHRYRVLFLVHPIEELVAGYGRDAAHDPTLPVDQAAHSADLATHQNELLGLFRAHSHFQLLEVPYPELLEDPEAWMTPIAEFIGTDLLPRPERMPPVVVDAQRQA